MQSCILPCTFRAGSDVVIHWIQVTGDTPVHSYYHNQDQLAYQGQNFGGRTSLFKDQISRGNASLQLTDVQVQDQGRYKCYTSTVRGNKELFINLKVAEETQGEKETIKYNTNLTDAEVSCDIMQNCILPCSFQGGKDVVIHWIRVTTGDTPVHSYYHNQDQGQNFGGRTSLFKDQISTGNASLQLTDVQVQDQGRYKCYTSTIRGNKELFINLKVDDPSKMQENTLLGEFAIIVVLALIGWLAAFCIYKKNAETTDQTGLSDQAESSELMPLKG
ncbi:CD276 antigen-like [Micropterus salmoides]|uniref:CD276 antigen-like n=1 Tax=Micropterus salmoides TaxID=27706 RepID=UPI0018EE2D05|nr:CD276 antigen-like [Micropterus salmoides]